MEVAEAIQNTAINWFQRWSLVNGGGVHHPTSSCRTTSHLRHRNGFCGLADRRLVDVGRWTPGRHSRTQSTTTVSLLSQRRSFLRRTVRRGILMQLIQLPFADPQWRVVRAPNASRPGEGRSVKMKMCKRYEAYGKHRIAPSSSFWPLISRSRVPQLCMTERSAHTAFVRGVRQGLLFQRACAVVGLGGLSACLDDKVCRPPIPLHNHVRSMRRAPDVWAPPDGLHKRKGQAIGYVVAEVPVTATDNKQIFAPRAASFEGLRLISALPGKTSVFPPVHLRGCSDPRRGTDLAAGHRVSDPGGLFGPCADGDSHRRRESGGDLSPGPRGRPPLRTTLARVRLPMP